MSVRDQEIVAGKIDCSQGKYEENIMKTLL